MKNLDPQIIDLLTLRATEGLDIAQAEELETLLEDNDLADTRELDLAAAAASNACALRGPVEREDAPEHLRAALKQDADTFFGPDNVVELKPRSPTTENRGINWGWAAAATIALAVLITNAFDFRVEATLEAQRETLLAEQSTTVVEWAKPDDPLYANVTGDVVWNDDRQQGYLLLSNMPANDPTVSQYQLWVVDPDRDTNPVDGGVFDIPAGATTVIVPINAKLAVNKPDAFAITREQPGGVVVSQGPLLVVAAG